MQEYTELSIQRKTMTKIVKSRYKLPALRTKSTLDALRKPTYKTLCSSHTRARKVFQMTEHNTPQ